MNKKILVQKAEVSRTDEGSCFLHILLDFESEC